MDGKPAVVERHDFKEMAMRVVPVRHCELSVPLFSRFRCTAERIISCRTHKVSLTIYRVAQNKWHNFCVRLNFIKY